MARRRSMWLQTGSELQLAVGVSQHIDLGDAMRSQLAATNLGGHTLARVIINVTWQADALAVDFELCRLGLVVVSEAAEQIEASF